MNNLSSRNNPFQDKDINLKRVSNTNNDKREIVLKKDNNDIYLKTQEELLIPEGKRKFILVEVQMKLSIILLKLML